MTKFLLIASTMLSIATSPVVARDARPAASSTSPATQSATTTSREASPNQKYCVVATVTGSRIPTRTCKTRSAWMHDEDFDPLAAK